ncbi:TraU family protein [Geoalkalibacter halelectricus]|uniref:TraU family protein n=1 Tax=Geoalkalibacter halelectricus TaxID=2847045 RepID=UPI0026704D77|nr:TraU family protein [Geoalkalibacter halelectricus]MDO3380348.1 TraU family protein [Geoalkalibacter halelectricus]
MNPVTDVCWSCMFPLRLGGVQVISGADDVPDKVSSPTCVCGSGGNITFGLTASFWEPARLIETVKTPYCFPALGSGLSNPQPGMGTGAQSTQTTTGATSTFQQAHYYIFPAWSIMGLFADFPCLEQDGFDLAYMTEVDPMWSNDALSFIINPEALLFGNPAAQFACSADSVAAAAGMPLDPLFWCMGSWGSSYPLSGTIAESNPLTANAGLAARMIYKLGRELLLHDPGLNPCGAVPTPIWVKTNYRLQVVRPVRGSNPIPIGRTDFIWGQNKNAPMGAGSNSADNFLWTMNRKKICCVGVSL